MEKMHRKALCWLAVQSGVPKFSAHKESKLLKLHRNKISHISTLFFKLGSKALELQVSR
jgi:hypothetical protein